MASPLSK